VVDHQGVARTEDNPDNGNGASEKRNYSRSDDMNAPWQRVEAHFWEAILGSGVQLEYIRHDSCAEADGSDYSRLHQQSRVAGQFPWPRPPLAENLNFYIE
jgi:DnaJ-class molecular chaperone